MQILVGWTSYYSLPLEELGESLVTACFTLALLENCAITTPHVAKEQIPSEYQCQCVRNI